MYDIDLYYKREPKCKILAASRLNQVSGSDKICLIIGKNVSRIRGAAHICTRWSTHIGPYFILRLYSRKLIRNSKLYMKGLSIITLTIPFFGV